MPAFDPSELRSVVGKLMTAAPSDVKLVAERLRDHVLETRMTPEATRAFVADLGYDSIEAFCAAIGLPEHIARRWDRFGVSSEMKQVFTLVLEQRRQPAAEPPREESVVEMRMSPQETRAFVAELGYGSLEAFCAVLGLPEHVARRWASLGMPPELKQVFTQVLDQRRRLAAAVDEFESMTHVGLDDFLAERGLI